MPFSSKKQITPAGYLGRMAGAIVNLGLMALTALSLSGCAPAGREAKILLRYQFMPGQTYRVTTSYQIFSGLEKVHGHRRFAREENNLAVKATYQVRASTLSDHDYKIEFTLQRLRLNHDGKGRCRLEMGPQGGMLYWYDDEWTLAEYLGPDLYQNYTKLMAQPLAVIVIDRQGHQLVQDEAKTVRTEIHLDLLELLSRNRVIGKRIIKAFKVPPLLMAVFPLREVGPGDRWDSLNGRPDQAPPSEDSPANTFFYRQRRQDVALIDYGSTMDFTGDELTKLQQSLDMASLNKMTFQKGRYKIKGAVQFDFKKGLPLQGTMHTDKAYQFHVGEEQWSSREEETYQVSLTTE